MGRTANDDRTPSISSTSGTGRADAVRRRLDRRRRWSRSSPCIAVVAIVAVASPIASTTRDPAMTTSIEHVRAYVDRRRREPRRARDDVRRAGRAHAIPPSLVTSLGAVPGSRPPRACSDASSRCATPTGETLGHGRPTVALSWNGTAGLDLHEGLPPAGRGEVAIDVDTSPSTTSQIGDQVHVPAYGALDHRAGRPRRRPRDSASTADHDRRRVHDRRRATPESRASRSTAFDAATLLELRRRSRAPGFDRVDLIARRRRRSRRSVLHRRHGRAAGGAPGRPGHRARHPASRSGPSSRSSARSSTCSAATSRRATRPIEGGDQATAEARAERRSHVQALPEPARPASSSGWSG